jgi:hypothetical protein
MCFTRKGDVTLYEQPRCVKEQTLLLLLKKSYSSVVHGKGIISFNGAV